MPRVKPDEPSPSALHTADSEYQCNAMPHRVRGIGEECCSGPTVGQIYLTYKLRQADFSDLSVSPTPSTFPHMAGP